MGEFQSIYGKPIEDENTLLFLDEIQATPHALAMLRFFYEKRPELAVIAAGSLLEPLLSEHSFSMPVGRIQYLHLGPMSFKEFLLAMGEEYLVNLLNQYPQKKQIPLIAHQKLLNRQREYLFVGGMPECISHYQKKPHDFFAARSIQRSIIQTYQDDFAKYATKGELLRLQKVFRSIPKIIGKKIVYSQISPEEHSRFVQQTIDLLIKARLFIPAYHTTCSGLPLAAGIQEKVYKPFFLDVGLYNYLCGVEWTMISRLDERALVNEGEMTKQFIAQHLAYQDKGLEPPHLFYWLREGKSANAEVDFVFSQNEQIIPIEVKAGKSGSLKSLLQFTLQKNINLAYRFDLNPPSVQQIQHKIGQNLNSQQTQFKLCSFPLYLIEEAIDSR